MNPVSLFNVMDEGVAVKALAALAQSSRLKVFRAIVGAGPEGIQPGQLSAALDIPAKPEPITMAFLGIRRVRGFRAIAQSFCGELGIFYFLPFRVEFPCGWLFLRICSR